jgi:hypothetical protein
VFSAVSRGSISTPDVIQEGELAVITPRQHALAITARGDRPAVFVLGSAKAHDHELHLGQYSVHTSAAALAIGEKRIADLGLVLRKAGDRRQASGASPVFR